MSDKTSIEWTRGEDGTPGATWNPVRGCVKVSPGCKHCYAETFAERFRGAYQRHPKTKLVVIGPDGAPVKHPYHDGFDPRLVPEALDVPLRWKKPRTIFVNSMSDLFGDFVPNEYVAAVFGVMAATPRHTYQVLTKRAARLPEWMNWLRCHPADWTPGSSAHGDHMALRARWLARQTLTASDGIAILDAPGARWPLPNVWIGVSVEDKRYGLPRIEHLRRTPAAVRFLSIEPLLEDLGDIDLTGIHWVIVGGESGNGARPMHPDWALSIRDQCIAAKVPFFFKQWGEWAGMSRCGKKAAGRLLDGRTWDEMPARSQ